MKRLIFILFLFPLVISAQETNNEAKLTLELSTDTVLIGNYLEIRYTALNVDGQIEPPAFEDFDVVGGPTYSTSMSIINGVTTKSSSYSYLIQPREIGVVHLGPAYLQTKEGNLETDPCEIVCLPNPEGIVSESRIKRAEAIPRFNRPQLRREQPKKKLKVTKI